MCVRLPPPLQLANIYTDRYKQELMPNLPTPKNLRYRRDYVPYKVEKRIAVSDNITSTILKI